MAGWSNGTGASATFLLEADDTLAGESRYNLEKDGNGKIIVFSRPPWRRASSTSDLIRPFVTQRYSTPVTWIRWATAAAELRGDMGNGSRGRPESGCVRRI